MESPGRLVSTLNKKPKENPMLVSYRASSRSPKSDSDAALTTMDNNWTRRCKAWLTENPTMNMALVLWVLCVGVSGGMLVLLLLGLLDGAFPAPESRKRWIEVNNQVLNALFTLMSVYQHPVLCHHLFLLCRWSRHDITDLRAAYCKEKEEARPRPWERAHMAIVVALLHLTVLCQYVLCGLYWGFTRTTRPEVLEDGFFVLGVVAPVAAAVYAACSPLGRRPDHRHELFSSSDDAMPEVSLSVKEECIAGDVVIEPEWAGGMFDYDPTNWCISACCTFCVFGWNAERLGLGNRYVHALTFALLCFAPLCVLGISALHIHNLVIGDVVGGAGVVLCACGLLYGGYWRVQMRKRFGLPAAATTACCGSESLTDYARWLLFWPCALAQELRTATRYRIVGDNFFYYSPDSSKLEVVVDDDDHDDERLPLLLYNHHQSSLVVAPHNEDEAMVPPAAVVVQVDECDGVPSDGDMINYSSSVTVITEKHEAVVNEDADQLSNESWRVEKVKKLINMVTLLSLLFLLYTRGFIIR